MIEKSQTFSPGADALHERLLETIECQLERLEAVSFVVDMATVTSKPNSGGQAVVVDHSDAMHALLVIRKALREAAFSLSRIDPQEGGTKE